MYRWLSLLADDGAVPQTTKLPVLGYARVSTEEQAVQGCSIDLQRQRIEAALQTSRKIASAIIFELP